MRSCHLLFVFAAAFSFISSAMSETAEQSVDNLFQRFSGPAPGAAVMVIKNGKPLLAKAYGMANLEKKTPCSTKTNFRLASVTKQFTAMTILILAEQGKLSLDDKITKFFPEFHEYGKAISVRHLLTHTSGLIDYEDVIPTGTTIPVLDRDVLVLLLQQNKTYFTPGAEFRYSNTAYALLTLIVESVSGKTFPAFLKENLFNPLGMTQSLAYVPGVSVVPNRSFGYGQKGDAFEFSDQSLTSAVLGDGGVYSSILDLYKWDQALYSDKLVSRKMLEDAFSIHSSKSDFKESGYGYGWYLGEHRGVKEIWHYGSTCGFSTEIKRYPDKQLTVIVLTNRRDAEIKETVMKVVDLYW
ncbi:MAG: Penicillin-binding protein 4 [Verrucomicrobiales bacterium]|nr:Penicillin-binding protein 4 [Verrucomicrobiales bacterium]